MQDDVEENFQLRTTITQRKEMRVFGINEFVCFVGNVNVRIDRSDLTL